MFPLAMEGNKRAGGASGSGVVLSPRRQRGRNSLDGEEKTGEISESRFRKRPKKVMHGLAAPANSLNKRKCWGMAQDTQPVGSLEEVKVEDDDEPSAPPQVQKHGRSRVQSKENKFFMDFSVVPRKQRSSNTSSSMLTSMGKKQHDSCFNQQQSPVKSMNGSSPNRKKRWKPSGTEFHAMMVSQVSDFSTVSDQEAEVAEALFVLATSSRPTHRGVMQSKSEAKLDTEAKLSAAQQRCVVFGSSSGPGNAGAGPDGKRARVDAEKREEKSPTAGVAYYASSPSKLVNSSVGEIELEFALPKQHSFAGEATSFCSETSNSKISVGSPNCVPRWPCQGKETTPRVLEEQSQDCNRAKELKQETQITAELKESRPEVANKRMSIAMQRNNLDSLGSCDEAFAKSSRSDGVHNCKSEIDLMKKALEGENEREHSSPLLVKDDSRDGLHAGTGYSKPKGSADGRTQGSNHDTEDKSEKTTPETARRTQDGDVKEEEHLSKPSPNRKINDTGTSSVSSCYSSISSTAVSRHAPMGLDGWMSGFSNLSYDGSAATSWAAASSQYVNMKAAQPAIQIPYAAASSPIAKMKSCATHVHIAHYIYCEQQATRRSLLSAALCRATANNVNITPVKQLDHERAREACVGFAQKAQTSQSSLQRIASSGSTHGSSAEGSSSGTNLSTSSRASSETSTVTASGHPVADHAHYLQTMMQPSGVASFRHLVNGRSGQAPQLFNGPFFQPHLISHLQPSTQQAANVLSVQMQQQAKGASSSPMEQQKSFQSTFQLQQQPQNFKQTSVSASSAHLERESKDLSLMAPSGGGYVGQFQEIFASLLSGQQQHPSSQNTVSCTGHGVKGPDRSFSSAGDMIVGPRPLGLVSALSMAPIGCPGVQPGSYKRDQIQRTSHEATFINENALVRDFTEDKRVIMKQGGAFFDLIEAVVEPASRSLCGSSANPND